MRRVDLRICGFPDNGVSHHRHAGGKVSGDSRKVEWCDGKLKAFERTVFDPVPNSRGREGLLLIDLRHEVSVEPEKLNQLTCGVDLRLVSVLGLSQHRCRVNFVAPRSGD